jgi:hypothetical protein
MLNKVGRLVAWFYHLLFDQADQRAAVRASENLRRDVEREWASLLRTHSGIFRSIPAEKIRSAFDYGTAIFDFDKFNVKLTRGRGEIHTRVSAKSAGNSWMDLSSLLHDASYQQGQEISGNSLPEVASLLEKNWEFISSQLSSENLTATQQAVRDVANEALERLKN